MSILGIDESGRVTPNSFFTSVRLYQWVEMPFDINFSSQVASNEVLINYWTLLKGRGIKCYQLTKPTGRLLSRRPTDRATV